MHFGYGPLFQSCLWPQALPPYTKCTAICSQLVKQNIPNVRSQEVLHGLKIHNFVSSVFFSPDTQVVTGGYHRKKFDSGDLGKPSACRCGHFVFRNGPPVLTLSKCSSKYATNLVGGFYGVWKYWATEP